MVFIELMLEDIIRAESDSVSKLCKMKVQVQHPTKLQLPQIDIILVFDVMTKTLLTQIKKNPKMKSIAKQHSTRQHTSIPTIRRSLGNEKQVQDTFMNMVPRSPDKSSSSCHDQINLINASWVELVLQKPHSNSFRKLCMYSLS